MKFVWIIISEVEESISQTKIKLVLSLRTAGETEAFSGSPRSDNYRLEFARGRSPRSPRTPRPPRLLSATRSPSTSGSELSLRQPIKIRWGSKLGLDLWA